MCVTLKVEYKQVAVRQNLDLYNNESLDKLVRRWLEKLKLLEKEKEPVKQLTELERKEAEQFLHQPDLLQRTNVLIGQSGVIGEENNRLLMYLVFTRRKREEPLHVISRGPSGTGQTHLQLGVGELRPPEDVIKTTSL
ncbi:hypothetical protein FAM09_12930 [Niastella caeni]|uniref:Uncharacterized protein n=1 Tax=Niastella caeni TaxID=2569763 RepID=A0A4S8HUX7_9BACT|nr:hypothetical protein [Niastella caeni]THU39403.1 hypothetical protein FAM09_12930 [Niastella caeni]